MVRLGLPLGGFPFRARGLQYAWVAIRHQAVVPHRFDPETLATLVRQPAVVVAVAHEVTHLPGLAHHSQDGKYAAVRFGELVPVAANDGGKLFQALRGAAGAATEPPRAKSAAAPVKLPLHGGRGDEAEEL